MHQAADTSTGGGGAPLSSSNFAFRNVAQVFRSPNLDSEVTAPIFLMQANKPERAGLCPRATSLQPPSGAHRIGPTDHRRLASLTT